MLNVPADLIPMTGGRLTRENGKMKITKSQLQQIIKEEL
jgi:hypothetical protein